MLSGLSRILGLAVLCVLPVVQAIPTPIEPRASIVALTTTQVHAFKPYTFYASAAYCKPAATIKWTCGANCNANPGFIPEASGGDGVVTQFWFVGFDPSLNSVIVSHQGTDPSKIVPLLEDADIILESLDSSLFPGVPSNVHIHSGFAGSHSRSAASVLAAVKSSISKHQAKSVTITGHSLGAAIALIDAVYLPLHVSGVTFKTVGFGMPRVGNQEFADYVDAHVTSLTHINNKEDIVPILPGRFLGFHHPSGEIHIQDSGSWVSCPGQDNTSDQCEVGAVPNIFESDEGDHSGPYDGVTMGC